MRKEGRIMDTSIFCTCGTQLTITKQLYDKTIEVTVMPCGNCSISNINQGVPMCGWCVEPMDTCPCNSC